MRQRLVLTLAMAACTGSLALGRTHPFGDPRSEPPSGGKTLLAHAAISPQARAVLTAKCADCHSAETRWPVYARVGPGSWLIERDIVQGRRHLDLSHWQDLSEDRQQVLEAEITRQVKAGHMPPLQYRLLHWGSSLTPEDVRALSFTEASEAPGPAAGAQHGDPVHGRLVFERRCTGCHAVTEDREGPRLAGVVGRRAASVPGFTYSAALKGAHLTWDAATLDRWLDDPDQFVPDNAMGIRLPKVTDRQDLITYLGTLQR